MGGKSSRLLSNHLSGDVVYKLTQEGSTNNDNLSQLCFIERDYRAQFGFTCYCLLLNYLNDRDVVSVIVSLLMAMTPIRDKYVFANLI
jgi:hypothetical protein